MSKNYAQFMDDYADGHPVIHVVLGNSIELAMPGKRQRNVANIDKIDKQPFIVVHDRANRKMVLDPIVGSQSLPSENHLCVDAHSFLPNGNAAFTGVGGWHGEVGAAEFRPTGYTSHGWNASETIALLVGRQEITDKPESMALVVKEMLATAKANGVDALDAPVWLDRLRNAR